MVSTVNRAGNAEHVPCVSLYARGGEFSVRTTKTASAHSFCSLGSQMPSPGCSGRNSLFVSFKCRRRGNTYTFSAPRPLFASDILLLLQSLRGCWVSERRVLIPAFSTAVVISCAVMSCKANVRGGSGRLTDFLTLLALCHTVIPERPNGGDEVSRGCTPNVCCYCGDSGGCC